MIKVIASDMDGTFLDETGHYDRPRFEKILDRLEAQGIRFVVATGNGMERLQLIFGDLCHRLDFVAENGTHVLEGLETKRHHKISPKLIDRFLAFYEGKHADYCVSLSSPERTYMLEEATFPSPLHAISQEQQDQFFGRIRRLPSFSELPEQVTKISMMVEEEECQALMEAFNQSFDGPLTAVTSGFGSIDVIETGYHKAWGLSYFLEKDQLGPDQVMAFGDGGNDIELLKQATYSYAMANAPQAVKDVANFEAPDHREAGVMTVIEAYLDSLEGKS